MSTAIAGRKVRLRDKKLSDARNDYSWQTNPELAELDAVPPLNISFSQYLIAYTNELQQEYRSRRQFAIETLDAKHIGNGVYYGIDESKGEAELGIMIGNPDYRDRGYGTDAVTTLVNYIFSDTSLNRIYLKTLDRNNRAQRCFQKCGFTAYGRMTRDKYDFVLMEMRREQWQSLRKSAEKKVLIQCDFDGTVTEEDESFLLLDHFAKGNWRFWLERYRDGEISVGQFNSRAFAMVKADKQRMIDLVRRKVTIRCGFSELVAYCREKGYRLVIVSNGLDFYIKAALKDAGAEDIEVLAAQTSFNSGGLEVRYIGPDGTVLDDSFKEAYTRSFIEKSYHVVYVGNGPSDFPAARLAHCVFAIDQLLRLCREKNLKCVPFTDFTDVLRDLENHCHQEKE